MQELFSTQSVQRAYSILPIHQTAAQNLDRISGGTSGSLQDTGMEGIFLVLEGHRQFSRAPSLIPSDSALMLLLLPGLSARHL